MNKGEEADMGTNRGDRRKIPCWPNQLPGTNLVVEYADGVEMAGWAHTHPYVYITRLSSGKRWGTPTAVVHQIMECYPDVTQGRGWSGTFPLGT